MDMNATGTGKTAVFGTTAKRNLLIGGGLAVVVIVAAGLGVSTFGLYRLGWEGPASSALVRALPYPAATVNGRAIRYADYLDDLDSVRKFFAAQAARGAEVTVPPEAELRAGVMERLVQNAVLTEEAARLGLEASAAEIEDEYAKVVAQGGKEGASLEDELAELYGWTSEDFKERVIRVFLLQKKMEEALKNDPALAGAAETDAKTTLEEIKGGADFAELATDRSRDPGSATRGGDLGFFTKGVMVAEFETAAFALAPGEVSDVVRTPFGFHIIKVEEVEKSGGEVTKVKARHILFSVPGADEYLKEKVAAAKVRKFVE